MIESRRYDLNYSEELIGMGKILAVLLFVLWAYQPSWAGTYLVFEHWDGSWYDADKARSGQDDHLMCWAAAAANILKWGHWDTADHDTESSIFSCLHDSWTNGTGSPLVGWQWWFKGAAAGRSGLDRSTGHAGNDELSCNFGKWGSRLKNGDNRGGYWPAYNFRDYLHEESDPSVVMNAIDTYLHKGYGVVAGIEKRSNTMGHVVTVWGFQTDEDGTFKGLYVTNSDDGSHKLDYLPVSWDSRRKRWRVPALDGFIREVWALQPRPA